MKGIKRTQKCQWCGDEVHAVWDSEWESWSIAEHENECARAPWKQEINQPHRVEVSPEVEARRRKATGKAALRIIAAEQKAGIHRPDAEKFKARMEKQVDHEGSE